MEFRYAVNQATGEFLYGDPEPYDVTNLPQGKIRVVLDRPVDFEREKWNGTTVVLKSRVEIESGFIKRRDQNTDELYDEIVADAMRALLDHFQVLHDAAHAGTLKTTLNTIERHIRNRVRQFRRRTRRV
jgi:hypothetical protein